MKKIKNKFILVVIFIISIIIVSQVFTAYSQSKKDTNSYLELIQWNALLNETLVQKKEKYILEVWDKVSTQVDSLAVISWGDGSLTRLGENTKITVEQNEISKDYTDINISFDLLSGKTWSQVVSFIWEDSSFTQQFNGIEAWVRGTIFEVDVDSEYMRVHDHAVELTSSKGEKLTVGNGEVLDLNTFTLMRLAEFFRDYRDKTWDDINKNLDNEHIIYLKKDIQKNISQAMNFLFILDWISPKYRIIHSLHTAEEYSEVKKLLDKLSDEQKKEVYTAVLSQYQKINFAGVGNYDLYKKKIMYKKALIYLWGAENEDSKRLVERSVYDLETLSSAKAVEGIQETFDFLYENKAILESSDIPLPDFNFDFIPEGLRRELYNNFTELKTVLDMKWLSIPSNIEGVEDTISEGVNSLNKGVHGILDNTFWKLLKD